MKEEIKASFVGDGENAWRRAKTIKAKAIQWTAIYKPDAKGGVPSGSPERKRHKLNALLETLWKANKKSKGGTLPRSF